MTTIYRNIKFNNYGTLVCPANTEVTVAEGNWVYTSYGTEIQDDYVGESILPNNSDSFTFAEDKTLWNVKYNLNLDFFKLQTGETVTCRLKYEPGPNSSDAAFVTEKVFTMDSVDKLITNNIMGNTADKLSVTLTFNVAKTIDFDEDGSSATPPADEPGLGGGGDGLNNEEVPPAATMEPCSIEFENLIEGINDLFYENPNGETSQLVKGATTSMTLTQKLIGNSITFFLTQDGTATGKPRLTEKITSKIVNISANSSDTTLTPPSQGYWLEDDSLTTDITARTLVFANPGTTGIDWTINCTFRGL